VQNFLVLFLLIYGPDFPSRNPLSRVGSFPAAEVGRNRHTSSRPSPLYLAAPPRSGCFLYRTSNGHPNNRRGAMLYAVLLCALCFVSLVIIRHSISDARFGIPCLGACAWCLLVHHEAASSNRPPLWLWLWPLACCCCGRRKNVRCETGFALRFEARGPVPAGASLPPLMAVGCSSGWCAAPCLCLLGLGVPNWRLKRHRRWKTAHPSKRQLHGGSLATKRAMQRRTNRESVAE
jgi:hypothetical protein